MKKLFYPLFIGVLFTSVVLIDFKSQAQSGNKWTKKQTAHWYNNREWLNGLPLKPHPSTDQEEFARQYQANKSGWDKAFAYMKETNLNSLTPGKYQIDGENVYVTVTEAPAKDFDKTKWESHRNYSDIHYMVKGKEKMGVVPISAAKVTKAYDPAKDIIFYSAEGKFHLATPDVFFIISPLYAHRPSVKVAGEEVVKKIVIKIRTGVYISKS